MDLISTLNELRANLKSAERQRKEASFNIFNEAALLTERENAHSRVIGSLLNPEELHGENNRFLMLFLDYLSTLDDRFRDIVVKKWYAEARVILEQGTQGRADILIYGAGHCIIIENKMNNAPDGDNQLDRYYDMVQKEGFQVDAIVYLTLDGVKQPPTPQNRDAEKVLLRVGAFTSASDDLVSGWLQPCEKMASSSDSRSFVNQYIKLVKFLGAEAFKRHSFETFLKLPVSKELKNFQQGQEVHREVLVYRLSAIVRRIVNYAPFRKSSQSAQSKTTRIFQEYSGEKDSYQLDITVNDDDSVSISLFYNRCQGKPEGQAKVVELLDSAGLLSAFDVVPGDRGFKKVLSLDDYDCISTLDNTAVDFINDLLSHLRKA